ncbi:chromosome segregation protein SMC [Ignavigranum ruoffiae]|uniref:chromosome segregation protein SMC n=1 Tax=Ignavigranum ruoffiae TaxID=89093 RepID=UPI003AFF87C3
MYLARVEMTGFKSFADKTIIEFDRGMTAVVGPNGSGKSNLSEAIRWVLGEQSAKSLRGNKMEDVIFNGSQGRKPVNIAKVTLVLNNEDHYLDLDFAEISLTRSYHRNGDSQYFINHEPCRLKDIVDLLLDSGLGKNSFSIISQGQVEQIFLNKAEERRLIFEEAAGVQKYQFRKQEAERKLLKSQDHLSRVRDIIFELEHQLEPLQKQKEKAITYQAYKEDLEKQEIALYTQQIQDSKQDWDQEAEALDLLNQEIEQVEAMIEGKQAELIQAKHQWQNTEKALDHETQTYQDLIQQFERLQGQKNMLTQELNFKESHQADQGQQALQAQEKLAGLGMEQEQVEKHLQQLEKKSVQLSQKIKQYQEREQALALSDQAAMEEVRGLIIEAYQKKATANNQLNVLADQQQRLIRQRQELQDRLEHSESQKADYQSRQEQIQEQIQQAQASQERLQANLAANIRKLEDLQNQEQRARQDLFDYERQMNRAKSQFENLKQSQEEYVGYYVGVRTLMKEAIPGIHGPVAELIRVEEQYQTAIEIALAAAGQNLVVESDHVARQAIDLLKQRRAGRATFLPLPNIKARYINPAMLEQAQNFPGYLGLASDFVQCQPIYQEIIANLLGTVMVVQDLKHAQDLAKLLQYRAKIVSLDGDLLFPGGSLTGGKYKNKQQSMLQRRHDIEAAQKDYQASQQALLTLEQENRERNQALKQQESLVQQAQADLQTTQQQRENLNYQLRQIIEAHKQWQQARQIDQNKLAQDNQDLVAVKVNYQQAQEQLKQAEAEIQDFQERLDQANLSEDEKQKELRLIEQAMNQLQTDQAVLKVEKNQAFERKNQINQEIEDLKARLGHYKDLADQHQISRQALTEKLKQVEAELSQTEQQQASISHSLVQLKAARTESQEAIDHIEDLLSHQQSKLQKAYQKQARYQAQIEKHQSFIDNYLTYLNQEYQLSFEAALKRAQALELDEVNFDTVRALKQQIEQLGPVNLQAIEDYDQLNERYQALTYQENDLLKAMEQLQTTMDEMDQEVIQRFAYTFEQINQQFQRTFRALFAGGQASLELTQPDDLLTTGVDILAQPPGKKKQNLALLSGGERALTAIALLFAILETRPVPFVVLDEVEAALDDANVYRYGEYIQNFTKQTQFIVITHRKGTMEHADVLYGVTMQQSGISKLASVKLSDRQIEGDSV